VSGLVLVRDAAEFHLDRGTLTLLDFRGRTVVAVFDGTARMRISPPLEVERAELARHMEWDRPEVDVERIVFLFADSTAGELTAGTELAVRPASDDVRDAVRDAMKTLTGDDEGRISEGLVRAFLNGEPTEYFRAHLTPRRGDDLYFTFEGVVDEEITFSRESFGVLSSFYRRSSYDDAGRLVEPGRASPSVDALHYVADLTIDGYDLAGRVSITLVPNVPGGHWIRSTLFYELEVDSVRWADGTPASYDRSDDDVSMLWIRLPEGTSPGQPLTLDVWYGGEALRRTQERFHYLRTTSTWLPRFAGSEPTFDLTFRSKEDWPVMSVGRRVSRERDPRDDDVIVTRWVTNRPSSQVTFSVGDFEEYEFPAGRSAPVRIHVAEEFHREFEDLTHRAAEITGGAVNIISQADPEEKVYLDIENSLAFFSQAYGALDFEEYNVAEIPFSHGQAFPGMINLSWLTFQSTRRNGLDELFRAHEVAHQWWGIAVRPRSYRDWWLAEGLSEFSALWYMHRVRANPQRYLDRLEDLREDILDGREDRGPIWLGSRLDVGRGGGEDYVVTVYSKGAWIFHMLRNMMLDPDTGSEEYFDGFMQGLFTRFKDRTISTEEFQHFLETWVQADMQWFFDQWVYGTGIPTYRFAWTTEEVADGQVKMTVRIRQEDVPEEFRMPVPILLDFGAEGTAVVPVLVTGREVVIDLPLLPRVPDDVTFNVLESVLAEVHTEGW